MRMDALAEFVTTVNNWLNQVVWGVPMLVLIVGTGIYFSVRTRFFQVTHAKHWLSKTIGAIFRDRNVTKSKDGRAISQFQSIATALAATIGTGNITGIAAAIAIGGPGAVFWMWVSAFFGMMTNFAENVLGIYFRRRNFKGEWSGGAMYYLEDGLKDRKHLGRFARPLAVLFAIFCICASFGIGNMTQANSIAGAMQSNWGLQPTLTGIAVALVAGIILVGGIKRIGRVTEFLVPFMALFYIGGSLIILFANWRQIPYVFESIFKNAFTVPAAAGGVTGALLRRTITIGFKRGVFSNEAGLGSTALVHSVSDVKEPVVQGAWGIFSVFFDTIVCCSLTAFVLLSATVQPVSLETALSDVTLEPQYFTIRTGEQDGATIPLMDTELSSLLVQCDPEEGTSLPVTAYGKQLQLRVATKPATGNGEEDMVYTNVMEVRGVQETDAAGQKLFDENGNPVISAVKIEKVEGVSLVTYAFRQHFGDAAAKILAIAMLLFAFSTIIGWSFYGTKALEYLCGTRATVIYKVIYVLFIIVGATISLDLAWNISDTLNGLMALPNLIGLLALSGVVVKITKNYCDRVFRHKPVKPMRSYFPEYNREDTKSEE